MNIKQKLKKIICAAVAFLLVLASASGVAFATEISYDYSSLADNAILSIEDKIDEDLFEYLQKHAGTSEADWIALYLCARGQNEKNKLAEYLSALGEKFSLGGDSLQAMDRLRISLVLAVMGENPEYIHSAIYECTDKLGLMSNIYGLMLALSVNLNDTDFINEKISSLIEKQNENGGFDLSDKPDIDVTAMAIYSLSLQKDEPRVKSSIDKALQFLSNKQKDDGGFTSMGINTAESCAQVILALCSVEIDPELDTRFIKNGYNTVDALLSYLNESGGFSHKAGGPDNITATRQAVFALFACDQFFNGGKFIFNSDLDLTKNPVIVTEKSVDTTLEDESTKNQDVINKGGSYYKLVAIICVSAVFAIIIISNALTKRLNAKKIIVIITFAIICVLVLSFSKFESKDEYYKENTGTTQTDEPSVNYLSVSFKIDCLEAENIASYNTHYPQNGIIYSNTTISIKEGESVFDLLLKVTKSKQIQLDYSESFGSVYIKGVNYLYEFDGGPNSGWMYTINGKSADVSVNNYKLSSGDVVQITFVKDYTVSMNGELQ